MSSLGPWVAAPLPAAVTMPNHPTSCGPRRRRQCHHRLKAHPPRYLDSLTPGYHQSVHVHDVWYTFNQDGVVVVVLLFIFNVFGALLHNV